MSLLLVSTAGKMLQLLQFCITPTETLIIQVAAPTGGANVSPFTRSMLTKLGLELFRKSKKKKEAVARYLLAEWCGELTCVMCCT